MKQLLVFNLGSKERFAIDVMNVKEIMAINDLFQIPGASEKISGCMDVRGQTVPVVNLQKSLFSHQESADARMAIILECKDNYALAVSSVERIMSYEDSAMAVTRQKAGSGLVEGVIQDEVGLVQVLGTHSILARIAA